MNRLRSVTDLPQRWWRCCTVAVVVLAGSAALTSCTSSSSPGSTPSSLSSSLTSPSALHGTAAAGRIVFVSDQSVILAGRSRKFRFIVKVEARSGQVLHVPVQWRSSAPGQVEVTPDGTATAMVDTGSATIFVSAPAARAQPEAAQVTVASPAPGTLVVPSTEILTQTSTSVTLPKNKQTAAIKPGRILVSGSRGALLARVTAVTFGTQTVTATTVPASLALAFSRLSIHAESTTVPASLRTAGPGSGTPVECTLSSGHRMRISLAGPSVSVGAKVQLVADLQTSHRVVHKFELAVQATIPVTVHSGAVTVSAPGDASATCNIAAPTIDVPTPVFLGPVEIDGQVNPQAGVAVKVAVGASTTFFGPTASDTMRALDGMLYTTSGGWQPVEHNSSTGPQVRPAGQSFKASLAADVAPYFRVGFGISAAFGDCAANLCTRLAAVDLAFTKYEASWDFRIQSPFPDTAPGYRGPEWTAGLDLTAGPEFTVTGDIADLFSWIGVAPPAGHWNAFDHLVPLAGSPALTLSARAPVAPGGAISLTASLPRGFSGDTVQFVAYPASGGPAFVATHATVTGGSASAIWHPPPHQSGTFRITALLFDRIFGPSRLPYASTAEPVTVAATPRPTS